MAPAAAAAAAAALAPAATTATSTLSCRLQSLEFSHSKVIRSVHTGGVFCMDLDPGEQRYLLAGAADASIAVYDTQQPSPAVAQQQQQQAREAAGAEAALTSNAAYLRDSAQVAAARGSAEHTEHAAVLSISKQSPQAHKFSVSAVAWYPVDSGLFVSGKLCACMAVARWLASTYALQGTKSYYNSLLQAGTTMR